MSPRRPPPVVPPGMSDAAGMARAAWDDAAHWMVRGVDRVRDAFDAPVGLTPKDAVWSLNKATLYRYRPTRPADERKPVPLLLVYALINKPYIFDLRPGQSFVEYLRDEGYDVYLIDWGVQVWKMRKPRSWTTRRSICRGSSGAFSASAARPR